MKKALIFIVVLGLLGAGGYYGYKRYRGGPAALQLVTATVGRGDIIQGISATGRLQAVTTVQVGSQVSGTIKTLNADFNSQVKKGQVVAELEPSLFQTQVEQAEATVVRSRADVERSKVQLDDAQQKLTRAKDLQARNLLPMADLETAQATARSAEAALKSAEAQLVQGQASLNQAKVNLSHTIITAPIDGVVISRNVDVGQTVAASMQAPTLFEIANDLSQMQVNANIDEADIGQIQAGQPVTFQVDAYPGETFRGSVAQVRLNPVIEQNVVSYVTVINVPNQDLRLKPGMTATVSVEVARENNALHVPTSALRFTPTVELFASLGQPVPEELTAQVKTPGGNAGTGGARAGGASGGRGDAQAAAGAGGQGSGRGVGGANGEGFTSGDSGGRFGGGGQGGSGGLDREGLRAKLAQMSPEERQAFFAARGGGRGGRGNFAGGNFGGSGDGNGVGGRDARPGGRGNGGPGQGVGRRRTSGRVWAVVDGKLKPVQVRVGISNGPNVAVVSDQLQEGVVIATGIIETTVATPPTTGNPLIPQGRGRGFFRGGGGGGGARGGGRQ